MKLLVVGGGGREHAIIKKLRENPAVETIYALPGNGGIAADAVCVPEIGAKDIDAIVDFAKATPWTSPWSPPTIPWPWAVWTGSMRWESPASALMPRPPGLRAAKSFPRT